MTLSRPQRELLKQLVFRWPHPCFVVISGRGLHALVVTTMMRPRCLERLPRAYQRRTTVELREAGLITLEERFMAIPPYGFRDPADTDHGWLVTVTAAGRAAINAVTEEQQRRAQAISAAEMAARGAAARARGARIGAASTAMRQPPPMYWVPFVRCTDTLGEALGGIVLARLDGDGWVNIETSERFYSDPAGALGALPLIPGKAPR